ncbi:hypothetical protein [Streptomyces sp. LNU-CPARS28]|uniref:hypothetical protein n=1 Tax=Streptomyces sp. LNU-CPARS28 TaxID=3137371 RepID=UPI00313511E8
MVLLPSEADLLADHLAHAIGSSARNILHEIMQGTASLHGPGVALAQRDSPERP